MPSLSECVREPFGLVQETLASRGQVLLEGAQGALLDNNWGTYPFCTASHHAGGRRLRRAGHRPALDRAGGRRGEGLHHPRWRRADAHRADR